MRRGEDVPSTLKRGDMCNVPLEVMEVTTRKGTAGPMEWVAAGAGGGCCCLVGVDLGAGLEWVRSLWRGGPARDTDSEISKKKSPVAGDFVAGGRGKRRDRVEEVDGRRRGEAGGEKGPRGLRLPKREVVGRESGGGRRVREVGEG